jgi:hypothetical protein
MSSWQKSYRLPRGERLLSLQVRMKHSHPDGAKPEEIFAYAQAALTGAAPLMALRRQGVTAQGEAWAEYRKSRPPVKAEICFTRDTGKWQERKWETLAATINADARRVSASIPADAKAAYLNLIDDRGLIISTEHTVR